MMPPASRPVRSSSNDRAHAGLDPDAQLSIAVSGYDSARTELVNGRADFGTLRAPMTPTLPLQATQHGPVLVFRRSEYLPSGVTLDQVSAMQIDMAPPTRTNVLTVNVDEANKPYFDAADTGAFVFEESNVPQDLPVTLTFSVGGNALQPINKLMLHYDDKGRYWGIQAETKP
jgi:hypothetical protein